ncbi:MAG: ferrous iron transport protein B [Desulfobacterales bacterium]|nr:ferrous iron transport protein B [Desulfobacterales bacterium]MDD4070961.1 ferrous iron transport protein B [Desulfobacterales bacterium]MDD4393413.1 ferrous iron transport protein B [Desulfobacterales bacterium]
MKSNCLTIALSGNPNSGKTTIFNNITGTRQKVGNWPGVTVEKKEGHISRYGYEIKIVDLPGTYSLTPFSIEEIVARDFILDEHPDVVVDIIDSSNLERNLYLATQLRELDCKVLFALNMTDLARSRGIKIDAEKLSELLAVKVVFTVGNQNEGIDQLLKAAIELAETDVNLSENPRRVQYSKDIEQSITELEHEIKQYAGARLPYNFRWAAVKLLEDDTIVRNRIADYAGDHSEHILRKAGQCRDRLINRFDDDPEIVMTDERYGFIAGVIKEIQTISTQQRVDISRNIDLVLTNRFVGFPIFIFFIWAMFQLTFTLGAVPMNGIETGVEWISKMMTGILPESLLKDLVIDGIIAGVGSVIVFLPNILILFFCIAIFEDTGYMSRAAFLMDKIMHLIGLHGKSFIPMLMGFGCNVPAIMAARSLESEKDRLLTILITPFMSCSARLPIYIVIAGTFFSARAGTVIFCIYLSGILASILTGRLLRSTLLKGADAPFVMELPPYRVPMLKSLLIHMWDRSKMFLKKMGGIILVGSIVIWALAAFPKQTLYSQDYDAQILQLQTSYQQSIINSPPAQISLLEGRRDEALKRIFSARNAEKIEQSYMGRIGKIVSPLFAPLGIDWRGSVALMTGFVAKEIVISTMGILYAAGEKSDALRSALMASDMTPLAGLSMMFFVLLYVPCLATLTTIRRETNSWKWTWFSITYSTGVAWGVSFCIYQGGKILGLG